MDMGTPVETKPSPSMATAEAVQHALSILLEWQDLSSHAPHSGLQNAIQRVREQPIQYIFVVGRSVSVATSGEDAGRSGAEACDVLLQAVKGTSLEELRQFENSRIAQIQRLADKLLADTAAMHDDFCNLRVGILQTQEAIKSVERDSTRGKMVISLMKIFSRSGTLECIDTLQKAHISVTSIVNDLSILIRWWQDITTEIRRLNRNAKSDMTNSLNLGDIKCSFNHLTNYFGDYREKMRQAYDCGVSKLSRTSLLQLQKLFEVGKITSPPAATTYIMNLQSSWRQLFDGPPQISHLIIMSAATAVGLPAHRNDSHRHQRHCPYIA